MGPTELLEEIWGSLHELGSSLEDAEWATQTELPGWTVKDCVSHIIGTERMLLGEPAPEIAVDHLAHVASPFAAAMEPWVEQRRGWTGAEVLVELREVTDRRLAALRALSPEEWEQPSWSPIGEVPYREFMGVRAFDCWMHEQDIRRVVDRPGHLTGPAATLAVAQLGSGLGYVVGKRAGAPQGTTVVVEVTGPDGATFALEVDGRAQPMATVPEEPTARLRMDLEAFCALGGGRWDAEQVVRRGRVEVEGDQELSRRILANMAVTP